MLFQYWILFKYSTPIIYYMVYTIINGYWFEDILIPMP
jgi:hypothetical protein